VTGFPRQQFELQLRKLVSITTLQFSQSFVESRRLDSILGKKATITIPGQSFIATSDTSYTSVNHHRVHGRHLRLSLDL
jgi:hypothetical protein